MNPVSASSAPAILSSFLCTSAPDGAFQDVLDMAAPADMSAMPTMPTMPTMPAVPAVPVKPALPMDLKNVVAAVTVEGKAVAAEQTNNFPKMPAEIPATTAKIASVAEAENLVALVSVTKPAVAVRAPKPVAAEGKVEDDETLVSDKADTPLATIEQKPVIVAAPPLPSPTVVPHAMPVSPPVPQPNTEADENRSEVAPDSARLDAQPARLQTRPSPIPVATGQKAITSEKADPLPPSKFDPVMADASSFETRLGVTLTTSAPSASTAIPAAIPNTVDMRQLILNQDREWIGALSRDIASHSSRDNHLQFTLMPESLGQLDVTLTTGNGHVDVRLDASTAAAAQIIVADQARLIEDLRNAGLKLGQFEMTNRQNSNGQQRQPTSDLPNIETTSITTKPVAHSKALGRFA